MVHSIEVQITGTHPLLVHGTAGLDPTHPLRKKASEITGKRGQKKTEANLAELDWIDFQLALYHDGKQPFIPDTWILGAICGGARAKRMGKEALAGVETEQEQIPLIYSGPRDVQGLYDKKFSDRRRVEIQQSAVLRTRPRFNEWAASFKLLVDDSLIDLSNARGGLEYAGQRLGIGDFRQRFGRFAVTSWKEVQ